MGSLTSLARFVRGLSLREARISQRLGLRPFTGTSRTPLSYPSPSPRRSSAASEVHLLCIGYAFRPRLSSRLTLGGLALPRKPWVYGGGVFHSALVTHASILTSGRSTMGRPTASPRTESSPTTS